MNGTLSDVATLSNAQPAPLYTEACPALCLLVLELYPEDLPLPSPYSCGQNHLCRHMNTHTKVHEPTAHLLSRAICSLDVFFEKPNQHQRHPDPPCPSESPYPVLREIPGGHCPLSSVQRSSPRMSIILPGRIEAPAFLSALLKATSFRLYWPCQVSVTASFSQSLWLPRASAALLTSWYLNVLFLPLSRRWAL